MKFNCDTFRQRRVERRRAENEWRVCFAWLPVRVAPGDCRWLEIVERRRNWSPLSIEEYFDCAPAWEYRLVHTPDWKGRA